MEINLIKTSSGMIIPSLEEDAEKLGKIKAGAPFSADVTRTRNGKFLRKFFAMLDVGFSAWEPDAIDCKHGEPEKNREQFRGDAIILAGFYEVRYRLDGSHRVIPKSISFANMKEEEFERVYSEVANVILQRILKNYTRDDLDNVVNQVLGFV